MKTNHPAIFSFLFLLPIFLNAQTVTTLAQNVGIDDGLVLDAEGNLYGSNYDGSDVFKMTPDGIVTSFASGFNTPNDLKIDNEGVIYMADNVGNRIYKLYADGTVETFIDYIYNPSGLIFLEDSDTLIVTSFMGDELTKVAPDGEMEVYSTSTDYNGPVGMCYDEEGNLYIANFNNRQIFKLDTEGELSFFAQPPGSGYLGFIAYTNGYIYATLFSNHRIYRIDLDGNATLYLGSSAGSVDGDASVAKFNNPNGILPSPSGDSLYISDYGTKSVRLITDLEGTATSTERIQEESFELQISPNPVATFGQISLTLDKPRKVQAVLVDASGRSVLEIIPSTKMERGTQEMSFDIGNLAVGIYFCQIQLDDEYSLIRKLVINKH